jgi:hypothetical protein
VQINQGRFSGGEVEGPSTNIRSFHDVSGIIDLNKPSAQQYQVL